MVKFQGCHYHGNSQLTGPLPSGLSTRLLSREEVERASCPWGTEGVGGGVGRRSDPTGFSCVFQRRKWKRHNAASKCYCYLRDNGRLEVVTWTGTRDPPRKPLRTLPLENHSVEGSQTRGFRMGDGSAHLKSPPSNTKGRPGTEGPSPVGLPQADRPLGEGTAMVPLEGVSSLALGVCKQGDACLGGAWSS